MTQSERIDLRRRYAEELLRQQAQQDARMRSFTTKLAKHQVTLQALYHSEQVALLSHYPLYRRSNPVGAYLWEIITDWQTSGQWLDKYMKT